MKSISYLLLASLFFFACNTGADKAQDVEVEKKEPIVNKTIEYPELGKAMCKCLEPSLQLYEKQVELAEKKDLEGIKKLKSRQKEVIETANLCLINLEREYPDVADIKEEKMIAVMEENCPEIAAYWKKL